jgi:hypothetical protein
VFNHPFFPFSAPLRRPLLPLSRAFLSWRRPHDERHRPNQVFVGRFFGDERGMPAYPFGSSPLPSPSCRAKSNSPNPNVWLFEFGSDHVFYLLPSVFLQKLSGVDVHVHVLCCVRPWWQGIFLFPQNSSANTPLPTLSFSMRKSYIEDIHAILV